MKGEMKRRLDNHHHHRRHRRIHGCTSSVGNFMFGQDFLMHERSLES